MRVRMQQQEAHEQRCRALEVLVENRTAELAHAREEATAARAEATAQTERANAASERAEAEMERAAIAEADALASREAMVAAQESAKAAEARAEAAQARAAEAIAEAKAEAEARAVVAIAAAEEAAQAAAQNEIQSARAEAAAAAEAARAKAEAEVARAEERIRAAEAAAAERIEAAVKAATEEAEARVTETRRTAASKRITASLSQAVHQRKAVESATASAVAEAKKEGSAEMARAVTDLRAALEEEYACKLAAATAQAAEEASQRAKEEELALREQHRLQMAEMTSQAPPTGDAAGSTDDTSARFNSTLRHSAASPSVGEGSQRPLTPARGLDSPPTADAIGDGRWPRPPPSRSPSPLRHTSSPRPHSPVAASSAGASSRGQQSDTRPAPWSAPPDASAARSPPTGAPMRAVRASRADTAHGQGTDAHRRSSRTDDAPRPRAQRFGAELEDARRGEVVVPEPLYAGRTPTRATLHPQGAPFYQTQQRRQRLEQYISAIAQLLGVPAPVSVAAPDAHPRTRPPADWAAAGGMPAGAALISAADLIADDAVPTDAPAAAAAAEAAAAATVIACSAPCTQAAPAHASQGPPAMAIEAMVGELEALREQFGVNGSHPTGRSASQYTPAYELALSPRWRSHRAPPIFSPDGCFSSAHRFPPSIFMDADAIASAHRARSMRAHSPGPGATYEVAGAAVPASALARAAPSGSVTPMGHWVSSSPRQGQRSPPPSRAGGRDRKPQGALLLAAAQPEAGRFLVTPALITGLAESVERRSARRHERVAWRWRLLTLQASEKQQAAFFAAFVHFFEGMSGAQLATPREQPESGTRATAMEDATGRLRRTSQTIAAWASERTVRLLERASQRDTLATAASDAAERQLTTAAIQLLRCTDDPINAPHPLLVRAMTPRPPPPRVDTDAASPGGGRPERLAAA